MNDFESLILSSEEKGVVMQALGGVAAGEISISDSKNPLVRRRDRKRAGAIRRSIFQSGATPEEPYTVKDTEVDVIKRSLEEVLGARRGLPEERRDTEIEQSTESLIDKVKPFANQLHQR